MTLDPLETIVTLEPLIVATPEFAEVNEIAPELSVDGPEKSVSGKVFGG